MSFDPRSSHLDDQDPRWDQLDEQDLPDDLALLAAQLGEDANHLAASYPAAESEVWLTRAMAKESAKQSGNHSSTSWHRWLRVAAAVAAVSLTAGTSLWILNSQAPLIENTAQFRSLPKSQRPQLRGTQLPDIQLDPTEVMPMDPPVVPATLFQTLSGPEQEAMLDLMEEEGLDQASLSI